MLTSLCSLLIHLCTHRISYFCIIRRIIGGRQVDGTIPALIALEKITAHPRIREAQHSGKFTVLFDSGIRRGADIIKAVAIGAQAVLCKSSFHSHHIYLDQRAISIKAPSQCIFHSKSRTQSTQSSWLKPKIIPILIHKQYTASNTLQQIRKKRAPTPSSPALPPSGPIFDRESCTQAGQARSRLRKGDRG